MGDIKLLVNNHGLLDLRQIKTNIQTLNGSLVVGDQFVEVSS